MTDTTSDTDTTGDQDDDLRSRIDRLERESQENRRLSDHRVVLAELKVEAIRAGIIDMDGLRFLDTGQVHLDEGGIVAGAEELIGQLKRSKPWLFMAPSSSSVAKVPPSRPVRQKMAKDMTDEEYRIARANIIRRFST